MTFYLYHNYLCMPLILLFQKDFFCYAIQILSFFFLFLFFWGGGGGGYETNDLLHALGGSRKTLRWKKKGKCFESDELYHILKKWLEESNGPGHIIVSPKNE